MAREKKTYVIAAVCLTILAVAGNTLRFSSAPAAAPLDVASYRLSDPEAVYENEPLDGDFLDVLGASEVDFRTYRAGDQDNVWVFLGYFDQQKEGSQVHSPKHCYPGSGWSILSESEIEAPWGSDGVKRLIVSDGMEERLVYYWFQTSNRVMKDVLELKYYLTVRAILRQSQDVLFVRISTPIKGGSEGEAKRLLSGYARGVKDAVGELYARQNGGG